ncbi:hypothetical protein [Carnobacterium jeotgali]|uniref:hypothetical protein n=1 Tax=Carnobacterium jeotgali TaxID=545534 RepID=UPI003890A289
MFQIAKMQQITIQKIATKAKIVEQLKPSIIENAAHYFVQSVSVEAQVVVTLTNRPLPYVSDETLSHVGPAIELRQLFAYILADEVTLDLLDELVSSII